MNTSIPKYDQASRFNLPDPTLLSLSCICFESSGTSESCVDEVHVLVPTFFVCFLITTDVGCGVVSLC